MATEAPSSAKRTATARPIPREAPVIRANFPSSRRPWGAMVDHSHAICRADLTPGPPLPQCKRSYQCHIYRLDICRSGLYRFDTLQPSGMGMDARVLCLGALHFGDASGYEIKKLFEEGDFSFFYETSFGSIYPALSRLVEDGLALVSEQAQDKRPDKKVYSITEKGRDL